MGEMGKKSLIRGQNLKPLAISGKRSSSGDISSKAIEIHIMRRDFSQLAGRYS